MESEECGIFNVPKIGNLYYTNIDQLQYIKNSIKDAGTPQPVEIVFNTMSYRSSETIQRSGYFQSSVSYMKV